MKSYSRIFHLNEISEDKILKYCYWILLVGFFIAFQAWLFDGSLLKSSIVSANYSCPSYFQNCGNFYFFDSYPNSYSKHLFYAILFFFLILSGYFAVQDKWDKAHIALIPPTIWKSLMAFLLTDWISVPWEYFHLGFLFVWMFFANKKAYLKLTFILLYFLSGIVKVHESWIVGSYFTSLKQGMPFVSNELVPFFTNLVIFLEITIPLLLFTKLKRVRLIIIFFFFAFHIYSITLVQYRYPLHCLPILIALFILDKEFKLIDKSLKHNLLPLSYLSLIFIFNLIPLTIEGDHKETYEGVRLSLSMLDANRQCVSKIQFIKNNKIIDERVKTTKYSTIRCSPYWEWFYLKQKCKNNSYEKVVWTFDISINGNPFHRIVDTQDSCNLQYNSFSHNEWINIENNEIIGYPKKNAVGGPYHSPDEIIIFNTEFIKDTKIQEGLRNRIFFIKIAYFLISLSMLIFGICQTRNTFQEKK